MKIGVLTFHTALNYGAALQLYALQACIRKHFKGVTVEAVDYASDELNRYYSVRRCLKWKVPKTWIATAHFLMKRRVFRKFIHDYVAVTSQKYTAENIAALDGAFDRFIVGSDQVWNPDITGSDLNYYLAFASPQKRFSYAASLGLKEFGNDQAVILAELQKFRRVSVREADTKQYLDSVGLPGIRVDIDPALLLDRAEWETVEKHRYDQRKYVLAFNVIFSRNVIDRAVELGKKENMEVVYVGPFPRDRRVKYLPFPEIGELLNLFHHAQYVVTNSFHGTVFSIIYKKQFSVQAELSDVRNMRIQNLLNMLNLSDRINCMSIDAETDWEAVGALLQKQRNKALGYLAEVVANGDE